MAVHPRPMARANVGSSGQAHFPGSRTTSKKRTMPKLDSGVSSLASLLDDRSTGELFPELVRYGLQMQIRLDVAAELGPTQTGAPRNRSAMATATGPAA